MTDPNAPRYPGAPFDPPGNPMLSNMGPAAYADRADRPDLTVHGTARIVPLRADPAYSMDPRAADPRGLRVIGADGAVAGTVVDVWIDRAEPMVRYYEVASGTGGGERSADRPGDVLLPGTMARVSPRLGRGAREVHSRVAVRRRATHRASGARHAARGRQDPGVLRVRPSVRHAGPQPPTPMSDAIGVRISGIDEPLPPGERVLWHGAPGRASLSREAYHARKIVVYFAVLLVLAAVFAAGDPAPGHSLFVSALFVRHLGGGHGVRAAARHAHGAQHRLRDHRSAHRAEDRRRAAGGDQRAAAPDRVRRGGAAARRRRGDIALHLASDVRVAYLVLWPHARPWRLQPAGALRALANADRRRGPCCARRCSPRRPMRACSRRRRYPPAAPPAPELPPHRGRARRPGRGAEGGADGGGHPSPCSPSRSPPRRAMRGARGPIPAVRPVATRALVFSDLPDGAVGVYDAGHHQTLPPLAGSGGFVRGALRALARQRRLDAVGFDVPFYLARWPDGRLTLDDSATHNHLELRAYGTVNEAAFAQPLGSR